MGLEVPDSRPAPSLSSCLPGKFPPRRAYTPQSPPCAVECFEDLKQAGVIIRPQRDALHILDRRAAGLADRLLIEKNPVAGQQNPFRGVEPPSASILHAIDRGSSELEMRSQSLHHRTQVE